MQQGGSPYQVTPEVTQYGGGAAGGSGGGGRGHMIGISGGHDLPAAHHAQTDPLLQQKQGEPMAEAASPISSRPPAARPSNFEELEPVASGGFADEEALAGEEAERGPPGNRWPRQETLALLKIRSEMDAVFREATLKGPLWEDVSRKLAELGYHRSAKKCKEKFENVHKYYKRTKEGRAGRQDGKSYRFFSQLEALHGNPGGANTTSTAATASAAATATTSAMMNTIQTTTAGATGGAVSAARIQPPPRSVTPIASSQPRRPTLPGLQGLPRVAADISGGLSLSSGGSSTSGESSDGAEEQGHRKRKRSSESSTQKMMDFFEGLMKQVVEKQVALQQKFLEAIEKREEDRMIREEAWKRQEMARLSRELEYLAQERAMSASRDAALIAFLQKVTGQTIHLPPPPQPSPPQSIAQPTSTAPPSLVQPMSQQHQPPQLIETRPMPTTTNIVTHDQEPAPALFEPASSRWPKAEVLALINLRSGLEPKYQEAGPKGPLWEEISAEMAKMGYKRSAKRCKEKWENINKYFKKVKESNKKRPEDAKTCPYFHQLDALYRKKMLGGRPTKPEEEAPEQSVLPDQPHNSSAMAIMPTPISAAPPETESGDGDSEGPVHKGNGEGAQSTSGFYTSVVDEGNGMGAKKPEDIVRELLEQRQQHQTVVMDDYAKMADADSDDAEPEDDDDDGERGEDEDDDDEGSEGRIAASYEARYRRQSGPSSAGNSGSFITMIQ
ncbi:trihelix transcription factor GTL1-like isoform X1 [Nymphaea colorata]|nr:trihelix transcription factor GTL1-like isoform X1 [Nymphaea colorata]